MGMRVLADGVVLLHLAFVVFVVLGGLAVLRWPRLIWAHVPAAVWGFLVEAMGWYCPLTDLENDLRRSAGLAGYDGGFVEHYVIPVLYPDGLTRELQWILAAVVLVVNGTVYTIFVLRARADRGHS
ncbi:MAG: DUF2784 domain-containing protein [Holophagales bacterium]|nr:DUF2784 domain-containing protein [Holophagales bacterium]